MRLGNNEKITLAILKKYPRINEKQLNALFVFVTGKKGRVDTITHSLKIKGLMTDNFVVDKNAIKNIGLPTIEISHKLVGDLKHVDDIKLGKLAKSILYVLEKTEKSSLQFLSMFFQQPTKNIYAIVQRLEEKNMILSYNSRIRRFNSAGRRYYPKYYVLTDNGKLWLTVNEHLIVNKDEIDMLLQEPEEQIQEYSLKL